MSLITLASVFLTLTAQPKLAPVTVNVNAKNGDVVSGDHLFRATVQAANVVTQVEFYVGSDLRDNATSTPYEFHLDTLNEPDGPLKLRFKAYTSTGETGEKTITVTVDNGMGKGVDYHVKAGVDDVQNGKYDDAVTEGRIGLKIDPKSNAARLVLVRAYLGKNVLDQAQKYAEDAVAQDGNDTEALNLLSAIGVRKAFQTVSREGGSEGDALESIKTSLKDAIDSRRKSLDLVVDRMPAPTDATLLAYSDAALRAQRYSLAIQYLQPAFDKDYTRNEVSNRLAYAYLRSDRVQDAYNTLNNTRKIGKLDAYGFGLLAIVDLLAGNDDKADQAIADGVAADATDMGVRTAQAFLALRRHKTSSLSKIATDLANDAGNRTEALYYAAAVYDAQQQYGEGAHYLQDALLAEPANVDAYVEAGNQSIGIMQAGKFTGKDRDPILNSARTMYEAAQAAKPESVEALVGQAVVAILQKRDDDALRLANAAVNASPSAPAAHYALAAAYGAAARTATPNEAARLSGLAQVENTKAGNLDQKYLLGMQAPDGLAVWRYLTAGGRNPVITPPSK